eukprot:5322863-Pyramimonas_sp.AAC.1
MPMPARALLRHIATILKMGRPPSMQLLELNAFKNIFIEEVRTAPRQISRPRATREPEPSPDHHATC